MITVEIKQILTILLRKFKSHKRMDGGWPPCSRLCIWFSHSQTNLLCVLRTVYNVYV